MTRASKLLECGSLDEGFATLTKLVNISADLQSPFIKCKFLKTKGDEVLCAGVWYDDNENGYFVSKFSLLFKDDVFLVDMATDPQAEDSLSKAAALRALKVLK